jgi:hypothetical protein
MKLHLITSLIVATIVSLVILILNSPLLLSFIILGAIISLGVWALYRLYKSVYQSVRNILGDEY